MTIEFSLKEHCPRLKKQKIAGYSMSFNPEQGNDGDIAPCPEGGKIPAGEIISDGYIAKKSVAVEIKCKGCTLCPKGFKVKTRKNI